MKDIDLIEHAVKRVRHSDELGMNYLYNCFVQEMLATSMRITNSKQDAEEIIQESFLDSFHKIKQLKNPHAYKSWLKRIVINKSLRHVKHRLVFENVTEIGIQDRDDQSEWYGKIPFERIQSAIHELPDGCRQVFSLFLLEDYTHKEIAEMLSVSISTSKSQYRYALKLLKMKLIKYND